MMQYVPCFLRDVTEQTEKPKRGDMGRAPSSYPNFVTYISALCFSTYERKGIKQTDPVVSKW